MSVIAIISSNPDTLETCTAFFRQHDHTTRNFEHLSLFLADPLTSSNPPDAVLVDDENLREPGTLPASLDTLFHHLPVVILGHTAEPMGLRHPQSAKPLSYPHLLAMVQQVLEKTFPGDLSVDKDFVSTHSPSTKGDVVGVSDAFKKVVELARTVAPTQANVFISGESGTGKEVIAKMIHNHSPRAHQPFVAINCSAIPESLLESELFGYAKGAFTGATQDKAGLFEEANEGTLFLDEIGDMNPALQAKLLRVLQDKKIKRVGENRLRDVDVRLISATHKDLHKEIQEGRFREDVFFRLNVIPIHIPPLRERREDILPLAEFFLNKYRAINHRGPATLDNEARRILTEREWKGNVRELENAIERAVVLSRGDIITAEELREVTPPQKADAPNISSMIAQLTQDKPLTIDRLIKIYIKHVLEKNRGAKEKTARELDIDRKTLYRKLQEMQTENLL
jgi:two-component system response regulator HydG